MTTITVTATYYDGADNKLDIRTHELTSEEWKRLGDEGDTPGLGEIPAGAEQVVFTNANTEERYEFSC